jgi:cytochrome c553
MRSALAIFVAIAACAAAGDAPAQTLAPPSGATLSATCTGCHGPNGQSAGAIPSINGRSETEILEAMLDFKNDRRPATVMNRHAKGFSDEELALMAREIARNWR